MAARDFFPSFRKRSPWMYVFLFFSVVLYVVIGVESFRDVSSSKSITTGVKDAFAEATGHKVLYAKEATASRLMDIYSVMFPEENNPIPIDRNIKYKVELTHEPGSGDPSDELTLSAGEGSSGSFAYSYDAGTKTITLCGKKAKKNVSLLIKNPKGDLLQTLTFDVGYSQLKPNHSVALRYEDKNAANGDAFPANSVVFIEDTITESYVSAFLDNGYRQMAEYNNAAYGAPWFRDAFNLSFTELDLRKLLPCFASTFESTSPYLEIDNVNHLIHILPDCPGGTYTIRDYEGKEYSFKVEGKATLTTSEITPTLRYYDDEEGWIPFSGDTLLRPNKQAIAVGLDFAGSKPNYPVATFAPVGDEPTFCIPNYVSRGRRSLNTYYFMYRPSTPKVFTFAANSPLYDSSLWPDVSFQVELFLPYVSALHVKVDGAEVYDGTELTIASASTHRFEVSYELNNGTIQPAYPISMKTPDSSINLQNIDEGIVDVTFTSDGKKELAVYGSNFTVNLTFNVGRITIFNTPSELYHFARKILGHALVYFFLGASVSGFFFYAFDKRRLAKFWPLYSLGLGIPSVFMSELIQAGLPERVFAMTDVGYNAIGYALGIVLALGIAALIHLHRRRKAAKEGPIVS